MAALGWLLNLGFGGSETVVVQPDVAYEFSLNIEREHAITLNIERQHTMTLNIEREHALTLEIDDG